MSAETSMLLRMQELEAKVDALETRRHRFPGWFAVLVCGFLGGWLGRFVTELPQARAQDGAQDIVAKSLKIVNDNGKTAVSFMADKMGGMVRVFNADGKSVVMLECDADGGVVRINGHDANERAFLGCGDKKGGGLLYFRNADGKGTPVTIGAGNRGGYITLNNLVANKRTVWIGTHEDEDAGSVQISDRQGSLRCDLGSNKQGGMMSLFGSKRGKSHVYLGTGTLDLGGLLLLRDDDGKVRAEIAQGKNGGYLTLNGNKTDTANVALATSDDQRGGFVQVRNNSGVLRAEMGISDEGKGYFETFDKK